MKNKNKKYIKYLLFRNLGMCLVFKETDESAINTKKEKNKQDLQLLNEVWRYVAKFEDVKVIVNLKIADLKKN